MSDVSQDNSGLLQAIQLGAEQGRDWREPRRVALAQLIERGEASPKEVSWYLNSVSPQMGFDEDLNFGSVEMEGSPMERLLEMQRTEWDRVSARELREREGETGRRLAEQGTPRGTYRPVGETNFVPVPESGIPLGALHVKNPGYGTRIDGTPKHTGWLGLIPMTGENEGMVMSEQSVSMGVEVDGEEIELFMPLLVPTLTQGEIDIIAGKGELTEEIWQKAVDHALQRREKGLSPFKNPPVGGLIGE